MLVAVTDVGAEGMGLTVTTLLAETVQFDALFTVTVYVPLADAVMAAVVAEPPVAFQRYVLPPDAVSVPDPQKAFGPAGVIAAVGIAFTVITLLADAVQLEALVTVTV